jgi:hypothetical protein
MPVKTRPSPVVALNFSGKFNLLKIDAGGWKFISEPAVFG